MQQLPKILLSFDVEEFDLPLEYGQPVGTEEQLQTGFRGLEELRAVLDQPQVRATLFTTAFFADSFHSHIRDLSLRHEIASHTYYHTSFEEKDLKASREKLEAITGQAVTGLRMPRMKEVPAKAVQEAGYWYNSSINPTWLPGRYNNLHLPRQPFTESGLLQFPVSVSPHRRIPLFWLAFKNLPYPAFLRLALQTLRHDGYICLYFHPWEFTSLAAYRLPFYVKKGSDKRLLARLKKLVADLSGEGELIPMKEFIEQKGYLQ